MYEFRPASDRIWAMRNRIRDRVIRCDSERSTIITEASKMYENIAAQQQAQGGPTPEAGPAPEGFNGDDVVDGDYKEI